MIDDPRPFSGGVVAEDDVPSENRLRPTLFDDYIGQSAIKDRLRVSVKAARMRGEALDHVLLSGPPGLGKTTLAHILANELEVKLHVTSGPAIEKKGDLAGIMTSLEEGDVLFIDEIHRLSPVVEENLYPAMEDFRFDIMIGEGPHARTVRLTLPRFTLVGATTRTGLLTGPLRARFGIHERLEWYEPKDLARILERSATLLDMAIASDAAHQLACRSRGTPRTANLLLRRVRDYMEVEGLDYVDIALVEHALERLDIDEFGLDPMDRKYLDALCVTFTGGPVGLATLAAATGEAQHSIENVYEPFLLQQGFLQRTPRGRIATEKAMQYLGLPVTPAVSERDQVGLFGEDDG